MAEPAPQDPRGRTDVDAWLGRRLRERRDQLGLSQVKLAHRLGVSFQQVQKYENGRNRVAVSRLVAVAAALDAPVAWFLPPEALESPSAPDVTRRRRQQCIEQSQGAVELLMARQRESMETLLKLQRRLTHLAIEEAGGK
jgi:transcriptional regulator with XRE-family HTH domain